MMILSVYIINICLLIKCPKYHDNYILKCTLKKYQYTYPQNRFGFINYFKYHDKYIDIKIKKLIIILIKLMIYPKIKEKMTSKQIS